MSAQEIIEQIKTLPAEEQREVAAFLREERGGVGPREPSDAEFEATVDRIFDEHDEVFRRLADDEHNEIETRRFQELLKETMIEHREVLQRLAQ